jgi:hypothetical protein
VDSRQGETLDAIPMPARSGGWGVVVGGRDSRPHGDASPWRRPLALGKTGPKVRSERGSCPWGMPHGAAEMRRDASGRSVTEKD